MHGMTMKRDRDAIDEPLERTVKRARYCAVDRLSKLSDELNLRILSCLPVSQLVVCERLSRKFRALACDSQLWRQLYYQRFVSPRASRLPANNDEALGNIARPAAANRNSWLHEEHLFRKGSKVSWKRQYRLRHNWTKGTCAISEVDVADEPTVPPTLVQMQHGMIYMVDTTDGLRAWSAAARKMVAHLPRTKAQPPSCLTVDCTPDNYHETKVLIGYEDGSFNLYLLHKELERFELLFSHESSSSGTLSAAALSWPYAVTLTATQVLSLYSFKGCERSGTAAVGLYPPRLLHSLRSQTIWPPLSASLRSLSSGVTICIAYALPTYLSGWTVGIQEISLSHQGELLGSRLASAIDQHYRPLAFSAPPVAPYLVPPSRTPRSTISQEPIQIHTKPTSLSYTHPYLLVSHPDNTLTLYLVTSTADSLEISTGSRLWGHTSSVSGAHIGRRGKAVSVSKRGDELRVWELEGGFGSSTAKKRLATGNLSVQVRTGSDIDTIARPGCSLTSRAASSCAKELTAEDQLDISLTRGWIGFDEENVILLKEKAQGKQSLVFYDFT